MLQDECRKCDRTALPFDGPAFAGFDGVIVQDRRIVAARWRHKAVRKSQQDMIGGRLVQIDRNAPALMHHDRAKIVDSMGLISMLMRQKHSIDVIDIGINQLLAQIGRGIDHEPRDPAIPGPLDEQRAAAAAVFRIVGIAGSPPERGTRDASRGSAAENSQAQRHAVASAAGTLENRRKKFSVVWREISSNETPRVSASTLATSTT